MIRDTTKEKQEIVLREFQKLLRSGKDYSTSYMYKEAGKPCYIGEMGAGDMVRNHYHGVITENMVTCIAGLEEKTRCERVEIFAKKFNYCAREARFIIRMIRRRQND